MTRLAARVMRDIEAGLDLPAGSRVAVALSGGADSVSLLWLLLECAPALGIEIVSVGHLNHGLRGEAAREDERFCRELAAGRSLPIDVEQVDVRALAAAGRLSLEHAGHDARRAFFERMAATHAADAVATGHTRDDQAETFLMRACRGASTRGLGGIAPRSGLIIRPLLWTAREELRRYLRDRRLAWREDASNADLSFQRNRFRHEILPLLERIAPGAAAALARAAEGCREDERWLEREAAAKAAAVVEREGARQHVPVTDLLAMAPAVQSRVVRFVLTPYAGRGLTRAHVDAVRRLAESTRGMARLALPGCRIEKRGARLTVTGDVERADGAGRVDGAGGAARRGGPGPGGHDGGRRLMVPGRLEVPEAGGVLEARTGPAPAETPFGAGGDAAVVDAAAAGSELLVRYRQPGDRLRPLGLGGRKSLQDLFVDRKVPRAERDRVPVVTDAAGRIVWVAGHGISEEFRVTPGTTSVLLLNFRRSGGAG
jgi:tRNA(Ile)-lysidine synthase